MVLEVPSDGPFLPCLSAVRVVLEVPSDGPFSRVSVVRVVLEVPAAGVRAPLSGCGLRHHIGHGGLVRGDLLQQESHAVPVRGLYQRRQGKLRLSGH